MFKMPRDFFDHIEWRQMVSKRLFTDISSQRNPKRKHCALSSAMYLLMPAKLRCAICKPIDAGPSLDPAHKYIDAFKCVYAFCYALYCPLCLFDCPYFLHVAVDDGSVALSWVVAGMATCFENKEQEQREQETYPSLWTPEWAPSHDNN